jgi:hypothetical protein
MPRTTRSQNSQSEASAQRRLDFNSAAAASPTADASLASTRAGKRDPNHASRASEAASSPKKKHRAVVAVTPEEETKLEQQDSLASTSYVPKYIHANVSYKVQGTAPLAPATIKAFEYIVKHYEIPSNLEQQRAYGPLSGSSFEERVIQQYDLGQLVLKSDGDHDDEETKDNDNDSSALEHVICTCCASVGHERNDCPTLI